MLVIKAVKILLRPSSEAQDKYVHNTQWETTK